MSKEQEDDMMEFIDKEEAAIDNIISGLDQEQLNRYLPKIRELQFLLRLLEDLPKKEQEEVEEKVKKDSDDLEKQSRAEQLRTVANMAIVKRVKPNIDQMPKEGRMKALMVKASGIYNDNGLDKTQTDAYLEDNGVNFTVDDELSTSEGLVLVEKGNPENVKIAYRGSSKTNLGDWVSNAKILTGSEKATYLNEDRFNESFDQFEKVKAKYGPVDELLGTSRGGTLAMTVGDRFAVDSTTFNPYLGKNLVNSNASNAKHTVYRTTDDIASMGLGFRNDMDNIDIKTIRPLKGSNIVRAHLLENFTEKNAVRSNEDVLHDLVKKGAVAGARHGESVLLSDMSNYLDGQSGIEKGDVYGTERVRDLVMRNPPEENEIFGYDPNDFDYEYRSEPPSIGPEPEFTLGGPPLDLDGLQATRPRSRPDLPEEADLEQAYRQLGDLNDMRHDGGDFTEIRDQVQEDLGRPRKVSKRTSDIFGPVKEKARIAREKLNKLSENIKRQNKTGTSTQEIELTDFGQPNLGRFTLEDDNEEPVPRVQQEPDDDFGIRIENQPESEPGPLEVPDGISFTGFLNEFSPADVKNGGVRLHNKTRMAKAWEEMGGEFTDSEKKFLNNKGDTEDDPFHLTEDERSQIYDAEPGDRQGIADSYHQDVFDTMEESDRYTAIVNSDGTKSRTLSGSIVEGLNPISLGIGLIAGHTAEKLVNALDPNNRIPPEAKTIASGASGQILGDLAIAQLSGEAITAGTLGSAGVAGGLGALAGYETYKGLKQEGASDFTATTTAGGVGGFTTGLTGGLAAGAIAGAPLDPETLGLASVAGGTLGAGIGAVSYLASEGDQAIKDKVKANGGTDFEADLASKIAVGSGIGTMLAPGAGTIVGGITGASLAGISALSGYLKGKMGL